jgi:thiol-disulfide isomerase/thioredoxin
MDGYRGVVQSTGTPPAETKAAYEPAPDIILTDMNGKPVRLYDYKGKIVLLNFWATWCTPCIAEFPQFIKLAQAMPDDLVILAVSIEDDKVSIGKFLKRHVPGYAAAKNVQLFWDHDKSVSQDLFQTVRVPETIVITPEMMMARKVAGLSIEWDSEETKKYLSGLKND